MGEQVAAAGARVVSVDRPGYGGSSPSPHRSMADWPRDIAALADHLGIDRFAVIGLSSGGPYVAACAALLRDRVVAAASIAGLSDMGWRAAFDEFPDDDEKTIMQIGDEDAARTWCEERYGADGARFFDAPMDLSPPDTALFGDEAFMAGVMPTFAEAFRQGVAGYAQDLTVQGRPWPFDVAGITCPFHVHHGAQDTLVPVAHAHHTAEIVAGSKLVILPDHGHISMITEIPRIAAEIATIR
jgi:pimeloyl-ACP methyl ester carboxylesterase